MDKNNKNIVSIEDRIPKLKEARKKKANRRLVFYLTIFFILISIIVYLQSPLSQVKTIDIHNNSFITDEEIIEIAGITTKTNIWTIDFSNAEEKLRSNSIIDEVTVERKLPWTVSIDISEKQIVGFIEESAEYYPVIESGEVLENVTYNEFNGEAPLMIGFTDKEYLSNIASELSKLPEDVLDLVSEIHWQPDEDNKNIILLYMNDGFVVQGTIRDFAEGMSVYPSVVAQLDPEIKGIIHMGVGVYFEAFSEEVEDEELEVETEESTE